MRHRRAGAAVSALAAVVAALTVAIPAAEASAPPSTVQLRHSDSPAAARTPEVRAVPSSTPITFEVDLALADQAGAAAFAKAASTPGSSSYGKYLTPAQWEARFSPSASTVKRVTAFLRESGFTVGRVSADRMAIPATGTARQVERAFATSLSYHRVQASTLLLADKNLSVPADIAGLVAGITGVSETLAHPDNTTGAAKATSTSPVTPGATIPQPPGFRAAHPCGRYYNQEIDSKLPPYDNGYPANPPWAVCGYTGPQFRSAYNLTGGHDGAGVTVAIVDAYAFADAVCRRASVRADQRPDESAAPRAVLRAAGPPLRPVRRLRAERLVRRADAGCRGRAQHRARSQDPVRGGGELRHARPQQLPAQDRRRPSRAGHHQLLWRQRGRPPRQRQRPRVD